MSSSNFRVSGSHCIYLSEAKYLDNVKNLSHLSWRLRLSLRTVDCSTSCFSARWGICGDTRQGNVNTGTSGSPSGVIVELDPYPDTYKILIELDPYPDTYKIMVKLLKLDPYPDTYKISVSQSYILIRIRTVEYDHDPLLQFLSCTCRI